MNNCPLCGRFWKATEYGFRCDNDSPIHKKIIGFFNYPNETEKIAKIREEIHREKELLSANNKDLPWYDRAGVAVAD